MYFSSPGNDLTDFVFVWERSHACVRLWLLQSASIVSWTCDCAGHKVSFLQLAWFWSRYHILVFCIEGLKICVRVGRLERFYGRCLVLAGRGLHKKGWLVRTWKAARNLGDPLIPKPPPLQPSHQPPQHAIVCKAFFISSLIVPVLWWQHFANYSAAFRAQEPFNSLRIASLRSIQSFHWIRISQRSLRLR